MAATVIWSKVLRVERESGMEKEKEKEKEKRVTMTMTVIEANHLVPRRMRGMGMLVVEVKRKSTLHPKLHPLIVPARCNKVWKERSLRKGSHTTEMLS